MVSTIRKAKEGAKRHGRGYNSKLYSCNAKLAARTLAYIKAKLKLRWSPEQISLRIDALLAGQTLKDDDGWTGDMGPNVVNLSLHLPILKCKLIYLTEYKIHL